jgi:hypothetical protein
MKKAVILTLLPIFLYSILGWQWMLVFRLNDHQANEWSASWEDEDLEIITVKIDGNNDGETYLVNGHELFHDGKYFDIKYKKRRGDEIVFYCHPDHEEQGLYASLNQHVKEDAGTSGCSNQKLLKVVKVSDFEKVPHKTLFDQYRSGEVVFQMHHGLNPLSLCNGVFVPPDAAHRIS